MRYFTVATNALRRPWFGRVFLNSPYAKRGSLDRWLAKARQEVLDGHAARVVCLVPAYTSEGWWHRYVEAPAGRLLGLGHRVDELGAWTTYRWADLSITIGRLRGRQRHVEQSGKTGSARFSSAVVVYERAA